jgi:hypothetical protein
MRTVPMASKKLLARLLASLVRWLGRPQLLLCGADASELPAVLFVDAWWYCPYPPAPAGPEKPRKDSGGGTWPPVLLRLRPCTPDTAWLLRSW